MRALPVPTQGELFSKGVERRRAVMQQVKFAICTGCGEAFKPNRADQRNCSDACRAKAHRQLSKKRTRSATVPSPTKYARASPARLAGAGNPVPNAERRSLAPCQAPGWSSGFFEGIDGDGLRIFFDANGDRLLRAWGPNKLSHVELRVLKLEGTEFAFPGGRFYRKKVA